MGRMDYMVKIDDVQRLDKPSKRRSIPSQTAEMGFAQDGKAAEQKSGYKDRPWIPRFWDGICMAGWFGLLLCESLRRLARRIAMAMLICGLSFINFILWLIQIALMGRKIDRTKIEADPIFVIGHWRSGTTLLHELLALDPRHTFADTYACLCRTVSSSRAGG